jgi:phosphoribosylaminoimidazolecarboxamide formyltransferase/IMP cyclohydrolase
MKIKRALISVSNKSGIIDFARYLAGKEVEILSTGGTADLLRSAKIEVTDVSDYTGFPEILDGRVKTLHPKVHGGLLYLRDKETHQSQVREHQIEGIDLVVVNLYPFEEAIAKDETTLEEAIEQIDIGGPSMLRSAAKNYTSVTVICDPNDYKEVMENMEDGGGETSLSLREKLAIKVFTTTANYDSAIANYLNQNQETDSSFTLNLPLIYELRYGENPHQNAALYGRFEECFKQLHGKSLSYNNILDISSAADLISDFSAPTVAILKHTNPCGVGQDEDLREAWEKAYATDKQAPFGGIIITNRTLTPDLARAISEIFSEVIIAPEFDPDARAILQKKKNLRLMEMTRAPREIDTMEVRSVAGGVLMQDKDVRARGFAGMEEKVVTERPPTQDEMKAMIFGWKVVKNVKSNAIVFCGRDRTLGIGAGQMSRVDAARIAVWKAQEAGLDLKGSIIASDAFFPFADGLQAAVEAGATACIQPGGSKRDDEVIKAANEAGLAMVMTGFRHFRH